MFNLEQLFKKGLFKLDPPVQDEIMSRIEQEPIMNKYWLLLGSFYLFSLLTVILLMVFVYYISQPRIPPTFIYDEKTNKIVTVEKTTQNNKKVEVPYKIATLPIAHQSFRIVQSWAENAVQDIYTFNFVNFDERLENSRQYFTDGGYDAFLRALERDGVGQDIKLNRLEVNTIVLERPILINWGGFEQNFVWKIKMPIMVLYNTAGNQKTENYMLELVLIRVPSYINPKGVAISRFSMMNR